ncbi:MAG: hypothetical protein J6T44_06160 [Prevotella sp.]|nr:hypothetical protein [Prevotella sp.]
MRSSSVSDVCAAAASVAMTAINAAIYNFLSMLYFIYYSVKPVHFSTTMATDQ